MNAMSDVEDASQVEQTVYRLLTKLFLLLDDCDRQFFTEYGLSARQFWALQHLDEHQGRSMVELSRVLFTDKSNVTGIVDRLERAALAQRTSAPHDRRVFLITLTPEGRRLRNFVNQQHEARIRALIGAVGYDHLSSLLEPLSTISRHLEAALEQGHAASSAPLERRTGT
jgi:DNA-binding MarR family transcriptional regulator